MQSNSSKNKGYLVADLHCHTCLSFDGYTTELELLHACKVCGIDVIAVTEHNIINSSLKIDNFKRKGIKVIAGCEYTSDKGAHIIGLFVSQELSGAATSMEIISHIRNQGGLVLIPHPYKAGSGLCAVYKNPVSELRNSDLIELFNGGHLSCDAELVRVRKLAEIYGLKMIASSDSHKVSHVGYYTTRFSCSDELDVYSVLRESTCELYVDSNRTKAPRSPNAIQKNFIYQFMLRYIPPRFRRLFKVVSYMSYRKRLSRPSYRRMM